MIEQVGFTDEQLEFLLKQVVVVQSDGVLGSVLHPVSLESGQRVVRIRMVPNGKKPYVLLVSLDEYCKRFRAVNSELREQEVEILHGTDGKQVGC